MNPDVRSVFYSALSLNESSVSQTDFMGRSSPKLQTSVILGLVPAIGLGTCSLGILTDWKSIYVKIQFVIIRH